jgi:hypothetical protein
MSPVRCGDGEGRKGKERRRRWGGGGGGGRAFTLLFLSPLRTVSRRYEYVQSIFFSFQRACGANCDIPCWLGRTTTRAKAAAAHCKRLDETENDNVLLT